MLKGFCFGLNPLEIIGAIYEAVDGCSYGCDSDGMW
jgi:hypothetical protein